MGEWGRLAVGNGNRSMRLGSEKLERNKETPPCQTVVVRDCVAALCMCVRERDEDGER